MDALSWLLNAIAQYWLEILLAAVGGALMSILKKWAPSVAPYALYSFVVVVGIGGLFLLAGINSALRTTAQELSKVAQNIPQRPEVLSRDNPEEKIREWLNYMRLSVQEQPDNVHLFRLRVTLSNGVPIWIYQQKGGDNPYIYLGAC